MGKVVVQGKVVRRGHRSLIVRLIALLVGVVALVQAGSFLLVVLVPMPLPELATSTQVADALKSGAGDELAVTAEISPPADDLVDGRERRAADRLARRLGVPADRVRVVLTRRGVLSGVLGPNGPPKGRGGPPGAEGGGPGPAADGGDDILVGAFAASVRLPDGRWRTVRPDAPFISAWQGQALLWLAGAGLAIIPVAWALARRVSRPIAAFADAAERLGKDPRGPSILIEGPAEVEDAARAFNEMQARLKRYVDDRTVVVGAMAHDIGTPLARLALKLEAAPEDLRASALEEVAQMKAMIGAALSFVRDVSRPAERQLTSLRSIVLSVADQLEDEGAAVEVRPGPAVPLMVDPHGVKRIVDNIARNAVRYAGGVEVALDCDDWHASIEFADRGPGLPAEELERAFEPFHRAEPSRNRETGGMGLGLASALAIARAHGGDIRLANRPEGGLLARVTLPR